MAWTILVARAAQKQLIRFPANDQKKIAAALRSLSRRSLLGRHPQTGGRRQALAPPRRQLSDISYKLTPPPRQCPSALLPAVRQGRTEPFGSA
jgi:mRNA-degrading endonuclease RelE of RelBE toxin-antitoxin system